MVDLKKDACCRGGAIDKVNETVSILAGEVMRLSRNDILMHLRFFRRAPSALRPVPPWSMKVVV